MIAQLTFWHGVLASYAGNLAGLALMFVLVSRNQKR